MRARASAISAISLLFAASAGCHNASSGAAGLGGTGGGAGQDAAGDAFDPNTTIIQEDQPGFDAVDGKIFPRQGTTTVTGYTGSGYADSDPGVGKSISWSVNAAAAGTFTLVWRYAFGGAAANLRDAPLVVNGTP